MISHYGVFRKDSKVLFEHAVSALLVQFFIVASAVFIPTVINTVFMATILPKSLQVFDWMPALQICITVIIALICAGYYLAEEKAGRNDLLLSRLPISNYQLYVEKFISGLLIILSVIAIQFLCYLIYRTLGIDIWMEEDKTYIFIFLLPFCSYITGIAISLDSKQTIEVIIGGFLVVYGLFLVTSTEVYGLKHEDIFSILPIVTITIFLVSIVLYRWKLLELITWNKTISISFLRKTQKNQNIILYLCVFLWGTLIVSIFTLNAKWEEVYLIIHSASFMVFSAILGVTAYTASEKNGMHCILFYHPVSLRRIYWNKLSYTLLLGVVPALGFCISTFLGMHSLYKDIQISLIVYVLLSLFIMGWLPCLIGIISTHVTRNEIYAFFAAIPIAFLLFTFFGSFYSEFLLIREQVRGGIFESVDKFYFAELIFQSAFYYLLIFFFSLAVIGFAIATDRTILTGTALYRLICTVRFLVLMFVAVYIIMHTGFFDLFYLLTGFDIGIG